MILWTLNSVVPGIEVPTLVDAYDEDTDLADAMSDREDEDRPNEFEEYFNKYPMSGYTGEMLFLLVLLRNGLHRENYVKPRCTIGIDEKNAFVYHVKV